MDGYNGDRKADLIYQGTDNAFSLSLSTGNGFTTPAYAGVTHGGNFEAGQAQYADADGDGKADLIFQSWDNKFYLSLSTGTGFKSPVLAMQHGDLFVAGRAQYADVNGDGKADLIYQSWDNRFHLSLSTGSGFWGGGGLPVQHGGQFEAGHAQYADVNGDGKADLIFQSGDNKFYVSFSTGSDFWGGGGLPVQHGGEFGAGHAQYADINGDDMADLIFQSWDNAFYVSFGSAAGFSSPVWLLQHGGSFGAGRAKYADVNGDGKDDLIYQATDNHFSLSLATFKTITISEGENNDLEGFRFFGNNSVEAINTSQRGAISWIQQGPNLRAKITWAVGPTWFSI